MLLPSGFARQHSWELTLLHRVLDGTVVLVALWLALEVYGVEPILHYKLAAVISIVSYSLLAEWYGLYKSWRVDSLWFEAKTIVIVWVLTCATLLAIGFLSKSSIGFSRVAVIIWAFTTPFMLVGLRAVIRYFIRHFRKQGFNTRSVAIVGGGKCAAKLMAIIARSPWMGLRVEGVYDDVSAATREQGAASVDALMAKVHEQVIDNIYITYPMKDEEKIRLLLERLADTTVSVNVVPDIFVSDLLQSRWRSIEDIPLISVFESPLFGANQFIKRMEDLLLGSLILILISPLLLAIAIAVRLTSPGPALFKQRRYGLNGQVIEVWKFRSMRVLEDGPNVPQATRNDPRVTKLGNFLRCTSLDELPQFFNVLQGTMSIVGPRPHAVAHNEEYRRLIHGYMLRHKVKPGITGWAQVNGWRGETDTTQKMEMRIKYDLDYINNWSLWLDLKIIMKTVFGGMRGKSAY
ncbi:MAG: undecaprenyl-phosphate glucose phosphotransferase [Proteobacteria bacterium]|nr:undecaprenyl-phosphate glucose phosphotransferase [Sideroxydans sp.]MBU4046235.1 undecaprenyl-phosphate glucose phosphotransferase [Gammaproteobacteria bacterium]MBU4154382.1 undecaprenyl-phosphate glucose phosphotransferase [Pseudomonadota bacterium]